MDVRRHLRHARLLTELLDTQWNILGVRFGLDPVFDLIPGAGLLPTFLSLYLVGIAITAKLPGQVIVGMVGRIILDFLLGSVPWLGTIFDLVYKVNVKNLAVLEHYLNSEPLEGQIL